VAVGEMTNTGEGRRIGTVVNRLTSTRRPSGIHGNSSALRIKVAVVEEREILRRGLVASLIEDRGLEVSALDPDDRAVVDCDIAVVSSEAARRGCFPCPIVVCSDDREGLCRVAAGNEVVGVLHRDTLTGAQLRATVHAAASGLRVNAHADGEAPQPLEPRSLLVLELIADGYSTREIAARMSYSERTIKKVITALQGRFATRSRAQTVAEAIRRGLI
jgi:DNA-binding CsgD family transcriptional regulator